MALTDKERKEIKKTLEIKRELMCENTQNVDTVNEGVSSGSKMTTLSEIQKYIEKRPLSIMGVNSLNDASSDIKVSMYFMSNKNVSIETYDNYLSLNYDFSSYSSDGRPKWVNVGYKSGRVSLEEFIKLPKNPENTEDWFSSEDLVSMCDTEYLYNKYQSKALDLIRSRMTSVYRMMTGSNTYKVMENKKGNTLYVMYDPIMKKFRYSYNTDFVLECALDEWSMSKGVYESLESCYVYTLAFLMTHEMLHIIHHNTVTEGNGAEALDAIDDHEIANTIMDSFINCNISKIFRGVKGLVGSRDSLAPMPKIGVGSEITVRGEHNKGFKKFDSVSDVLKEISKIIKNFSGLDDIEVSNRYYTEFPISMYAGADVYVSVDIRPTVNTIRGNNSTLYQSVVNDIVKTLVDGRVYGKYTEYTDKEKVDDVERLSDGQLVIVRGTKGVFSVRSYDVSNKVYTLDCTDISGTHTIIEDGVELTVTDYKDNGVIFGNRTRDKIKPYNPENDAYASGEGTRQSDNLQTKLSQKDIDNANKPGGGGGGMPQEQPVKRKVLNVGDYVWIARLQTFGRITSVSNGKFTVEEVHETPAIEIDDSLNH